MQHNQHSFTPEKLAQMRDDRRKRDYEGMQPLYPSLPDWDEIGEEVKKELLHSYSSILAFFCRLADPDRGHSLLRKVKSQSVTSLHFAA